MQDFELSPEELQLLRDGLVSPARADGDQGLRIKMVTSSRMAKPALYDGGAT
jgi:hypothetical protein